MIVLNQIWLVLCVVMCSGSQQMTGLSNLTKIGKLAQQSHNLLSNFIKTFTVSVDGVMCCALVG